LSLDVINIKRTPHSKKEIGSPFLARRHIRLRIRPGVKLSLVVNINIIILPKNWTED